MIEITVKFRPWKYGQRLFKNFYEHLKVWCFGVWYKSNMCDVWENTGIRILGIELNIKKYLPLRGGETESKEK